MKKLILILFIVTACGQTDQSKKIESGDNALRTGNYALAISIFEGEFSRSGDYKTGKKLISAYAGCAKFSAYEMYKIEEDYKDKKTKIFTKLDEIGSRLEDLSSSEFNCINEAIAMYDRLNLGNKDSVDNVEFASLHLYRLLHSFKKLKFYINEELVYFEGRNITVKSFINSLFDRVDQINEDLKSMIFLGENSYDQVRGWMLRLKEDVKPLNLNDYKKYDHVGISKWEDITNPTILSSLFILVKAVDFINDDMALSQEEENIKTILEDHRNDLQYYYSEASIYEIHSIISDY